MTHSGIGYIDIYGHITLPHDILRPLSIRYNSSLWGMYYPKTAGHDSVVEHTLTEAARHDFMITPVPPSLWKVSARVILKLRRGRGTMSQIASLFASKEFSISIIHAKSSRSSHRFSTWTLHIALTKLINQPLTYDEKAGYYLEVKSYLEDVLKKGLEYLHNNIKNKKQQSLLFDLYGLGKAIEVYPNEELHFFDWFINNSEVSKKPFQISISEDGEMYARGNEFFHYLSETSKNLDKHDDYLLNTLVFSEFDSRGLNMRLFVFPQTSKERFFEVGIEYEYVRKQANEYQCIGLISSVTNCLAKNDYNIWNSANFTTPHDGMTERGKLIYLIEDVSDKRRGYDAERLYREVKYRINEATLGDEMPNEQISIRNVMITQLSNFKIKRKLDRLHNRDFKKDVFISFSMTDKLLAEYIQKYFESHSVECSISLDIQTGLDFYDQIGESLRTSKEMVLLYSKQYHSSDWRKAEVASFWAMKKVVIPVVLHDWTFEGLDKFINKNNGVQLLAPDHPDYEIDLHKKLDGIIRDIKERKGEDLLELFEKMYDR